jgi:hypothetical protein
MHECPDCGMACDCYGDDLWDKSAFIDCTHKCEPDYDPTFTIEDFGDFGDR